MNRWGRLAVGVALSLLVHAVLVTSSRPPEGKARKVVVGERRAQKVTIMRMAEAGKKKAAPARESKGRKAAASTSTSTSTSTPTSTSTSTSTREEGYGGLLPGLNALPLEGGGGEGAQVFAPPSQGAATVSDELSGKLDIPLAFREQGANSRASVKLALKEESPTGWWFAYVSGDPLLRAVLYEALRDPANAQVVRDLFRNLKDKEIVISLRQTTFKTIDRRDRYDEAVSVEGNKIVIQRTRFVAPPMNPESGIALPDEEAKRAVRRDRTRFHKYMESPAYVSPLRERLP